MIYTCSKTDFLNSFMDASKYFWSGLSDVKFDAESESEVGFVLRAQGAKPQTYV